MEANDIMANILENLDIEANKIEGGFAYDIIAAVSHEIARFYQYAEYLFSQQYIETATNEYLDYLGEDNGLKRKEASCAEGYLLVKGTGVLEAGSVFTADELIFKTDEAASLSTDGVLVKATCLEKGSIGNIGASAEVETNLSNVTDVSVREAFTGGSDEETDIAYRNRILEKIRKPATSGNVQQIKNWAMEVTGVKKARVFPLKNGAGTVEVAVLNDTYTTASTELLEDVKNNIDSKKPVGMTVTVVSAESFDINISAKLDTTNLQSATQTIGTKIDEYLKEISYTDTKIVSYAKIGEMMITTLGVDDYSDYTLNGGVNNINLGSDLMKYPKLNALALTEV